MKFGNRATNSRLQNIQKFFVKSAIPIGKVMEDFFKNVDSPQNIDVNEMITTLSDAMNFVGTANVDLVKIRKDNIKKDLPKLMQGLCRDPEEFSATHLLCDNLNSKIKDVTELNKVKGKIFYDRDTVRRGRSRGRGRANFRMSRGFYNRNQRRPYPFNNRPKNFGTRRGSSSTNLSSNKA